MTLDVSNAPVASDAADLVPFEPTVRQPLRHRAKLMPMLGVLLLGVLLLSVLLLSAMMVRSPVGLAAVGSLAALLMLDLFVRCRIGLGRAGGSSRQGQDRLGLRGSTGAGGSSSGHRHRAWTPWLGRADQRADDQVNPHGRLLDGIKGFQQHTAPLVRAELARLAQEGQKPSHLFLTCADSRMVTSMITDSGPGDLFTVRNIGNLVPAPHEPGAADDSVAAAVQYAVEVLEVRSITVCGHSGCGAMKALLEGVHERPGPPSPLARWLRNGRGSLLRLHRAPVEFTDRPASDVVEQLCITNVVQQLDQLLTNPAVERRVAEGTLHLAGMYFDLAAAQTYLLDEASGRFAAVSNEYHHRRRRELCVGEAVAA